MERGTGTEELRAAATDSPSADKTPIQRVSPNRHVADPCAGSRQVASASTRHPAPQSGCSCSRSINIALPREQRRPMTCRPYSDEIAGGWKGGLANRCDTQSFIVSKPNVLLDTNAFQTQRAASQGRCG